MLKNTETTDTAETTDTTTENSTAPAEPKVQAKVFYDGIHTYVNSAVQFRLSSKDNVSLDKIEYKINNGNTQVYNSPFTIGNEGKNIISFYGVDKIGNKEDVKIFKIVVDGSAPGTVISTDKAVARINNKIYVSKDFTFTINSKDSLSGVSSVNYTINDETKEYVTPFNLVANGDVVLKIKGTDNVNNSTNNFNFRFMDKSGREEVISGTSANISIDNVAPTVKINADKSLSMNSNNKQVASPAVRFAVTATDDGAGIDRILYRLDGKGDFVEYVNEVKFRTNGEHTIEAKAVDRVGNESSVATLSVFVDVIPPDTKIDTIPE